MRGIFITFEGTEGCGKSTQAKLLYDYLKRQGYKCVLTREPGGTKLGEKIRQLLLHADGIDISDLTEVFLFLAARAQIIYEVIAPALKKGKIVICDRFSDATVAYQVYGGKIPFKIIKTLNDTATAALKPSLTILLDVDTATGLNRASSKGIDRMEAKDIAYHKRVRKGYAKLAKDEPGRIRIIKVSDGIKETQKQIQRITSDAISRYKRSR